MGRRRPPSRPGGRPRPGGGHGAQGPPLPGTLSAWLLDATQRFSDAGLPSPRIDAQRLAGWALGIRWSDLWARLRSPLSDDAAASLEEAAARRESGEPLAYITGSAEFCGIELEVGPGVLVPRPETETLVEVALELLADVEAPGAVDAGTGSGAVAIALALARGDARVYGTESSAEAMVYALRNARRTGARVTLLAGDLLAPVPSDERGALDLVVSNPPYVPAGREDLLAPDVLAEPHEALFAGPRGDEILLRLVAEAPAWLGSRGSIALEVGTPEQAEAVAAALDGWDELGVEEDRTGRPRVVWARGPA